MKLNDQVIYYGRRYLVRGFMRMGSSQQFVHLKDVQTGALVIVPLDEIDGAESPLSRPVAARRA